MVASYYLYSNCRTPRGVRGLKSSCGAIHLVPPPSHPSRGAWIEIQLKTKAGMSYLRRTPRGVRGLKSPSPAAHPRPSRSHPSRGAWIEINIDGVCLLDGGSHPSRGAWIEISAVTLNVYSCPRRTPRGVRGLKFLFAALRSRTPGSHPSRGAWIEIFPTKFSKNRISTSHPSRGAWIEIVRMVKKDLKQKSRTPRGVRGLKSSQKRTTCKS